MSPCIYCGVTDPESRIAALTEELVEAYRLLELEKAKDGDTWKQRALDERAAREQAEAERDDARRRYYLEAQERQHRERERDTALARVAEVTEQRDLWAKQCNMASEAQADAASKLSTALAALKAGTSREVVAHAETLGKLRALELDREEFTQRDAAERMRLVKLVQELEAKNESLREECERCTAAETALASALARVKELEARIDGEFTHDQLLHEVSSYRSGMMAAESALASARPYVQHALAYLTDKNDIESTPLHAIGHAVTELHKLDEVLSSAPSPAPCSGCAALSRAIDSAIRDMLSGGHPFEKGVAKAINDLRAAQKEHP